MRREVVALWFSIAVLVVVDVVAWAMLYVWYVR